MKEQIRTWVEALFHWKGSYDETIKAWSCGMSIRWMSIFMKAPFFIQDERFLFFDWSKHVLCWYFYFQIQVNTLLCNLLRVLWTVNITI